MPPIHKRLATVVGISLVLLFASGFIPEEPTYHPMTLTTPSPRPESSKTNDTSGAQGRSLLPNDAAYEVEKEVLASPAAYVVHEHAVVTNETVRAGDSMALIFARRNFPARALYALTQHTVRRLQEFFPARS